MTSVEGVFTAGDNAGAEPDCVGDLGGASRGARDGRGLMGHRDLPKPLDRGNHVRPFS